MGRQDEREPTLGGRISRRTALGFGAIALGSLAAACSRARSAITGSTSSAAATTTSGSATPTGAGVTPTLAPTCVLTPEVTEGPFYLPLNLVRKDITEGKPGTPLALDLQVLDATTCRPISGAVVDIWHADGLGVYSDVVPLGAGSNASVTPGTFLRGVQSTDAAGVATFVTIYPGWYMGRAVHIHVKVHVGGSVTHTGQLFFDDALTASVYRSAAPYTSRPTGFTTNGADGIFQQEGSSQAILSMKRNGNGYVGAMTMGVRAS